jgi:hypothetical protein
VPRARECRHIHRITVRPRTPIAYVDESPMPGTCSMFLTGLDVIGLRSNRLCQRGGAKLVPHGRNSSCMSHLRCRGLQRQVSISSVASLATCSGRHVAERPRREQPCGLCSFKHCATMRRAPGRLGRLKGNGVRLPSR